MALIPTGVVRINIVGSIAGGESLVHTLHGYGQPAAVQNAGNLQEISDRVRDRWGLFLSTAVYGDAPAQHLGNATVYTGVNAYALDTGGRAITQVASGFSQGQAVGMSTSLLPNEVACAVSLQTDRAGRTGRGRVYLGGLSSGFVAGTGRFKIPACQTIARGFADFLQALNADEAAGFRVGVLSRTAGIITPVTAVRVGDVPDVQRRRRNALVETYASEPVTS